MLLGLTTTGTDGWKFATCIVPTRPKQNPRPVLHPVVTAWRCGRCCANLYWIPLLVSLGG